MADEPTPRRPELDALCAVLAKVRIEPESASDLILSIKAYAASEYERGFANGAMTGLSGPLPPEENGHV